MQNLSNTPIPQWKIKYDSQFNLPPLKNAKSSDTPPENGGGKFPWLAFLIGGLILTGLYFNSQKNEQDKHTT